MNEELSRKIYLSAMALIMSHSTWKADTLEHETQRVKVTEDFVKDILKEIKEATLTHTKLMLAKEGEIKRLRGLMRLDEGDCSTCHKYLEINNEALSNEKVTRIKYQDIVYKICALFDMSNEKCTIDTVVDKVKQQISKLQGGVERLQKIIATTTNSNLTQSQAYLDLVKENEKLRAEIAEARKLLEGFVDDEPCSYDHHGYCQTRAQCTDKCLNAEAKSFLEGR